MLLFLSSVAIIAALFCTPTTCIRIERSRYLDINIEISPNLPILECQSILTNLEQTLTAASRILYTALDGRVYFDSFNIDLPRTWDDSCLPTDYMRGLSNRTSPQKDNLPSAGTGRRGDITITDTHHVYGNNMWTQQYGGCGVQGDQIYVPYKAISAASAKEFVRNWAKFRYGIFDEMGFKDDPVYTPCYFDGFYHVNGCSDVPLQHAQSICVSGENPYMTLMKAVSFKARTSLMFAPHVDNVILFCDDSNHNRYAPNKQNLLCNRRSTLDVILQHTDFESANHVPVAPKSETYDIQPQFNYRRHSLTRYVVIIDDSQDVMLRDSWSFLRSAIRKWVLYDLQPQTAVGIVLSNGQLIGKSLSITPLTNATNRDLVASFVPYSPSDSRHVTCISCALEQALKMFTESEQKHGYAAQVLLIISPGMEFSSSVAEISKRVQYHAGVRIATINYPAVLRRQPLDALAHATDGIAYSVYESKFNGEKSYLQTYLTLTTVLNEIGRTYYEGSQRQLPIEIHRMTLQDTINATAQSQRASHRFNGTFFMDAGFGYPAGFYVYTYSTESPLIQAMSLTSPSGHIYETRSDQRMPVKQLSLVANLNETGRWTYEIERFHGNPQPHIVQVLATPLGEMNDFINFRAWAKKHGHGKNSYIVIYCELKHGDYPVMEANVRVSIKRYDHNCVNKPQQSDCNVVYRLLDTGSGSPDIMRGDGIYSRLFKVREPSVYILDVWATSLKGRTYTIMDRNTMLNAQCCGSKLPLTLRKQQEATDSNDNQHNLLIFTKLTVPFERYAAPLTFHFDTEEFIGLKSNEQPQDHHILGETEEEMETLFNNFTIGRIADLQLNHAEDGKLLLRWLAPDFGDSEVARYELKYGFKLSEMIDRFDSASILWNHDTPSPLPAGEEQRLLIDPKLETKMINQSVYFGLRTYTVLTKGAKPGPVSNIVGTFVEELPQIEAKVTNDDLDGVRHQQDDEANVMQQNNSTTKVKAPGESTASSQLWDVLLAISIALAVILALFILLCVLWKCRSNKRKKTTAVSTDSTDNQAKEAASAPIDSVESATLMQQGSNYASLDAPDHQTIGIPIIECNDDHDIGSKKKRLSAYGSLAALQCSGLHGFVLNDMNQKQQQQEQQKIPNGEHNPFYRGLSIISMQTETLRHHQHPQPQPPPLNYDTWSQSSLLLRDGQRCSPFSETTHNQPINIGHYMPPHSGISDHNVENFSSLDTDMPPVPPLPISPQFFRDNSPSIYTTAMRGGINMPHNSSYDSTSGQHQMENNKRLRNVTMV